MSRFTAFIGLCLIAGGSAWAQGDFQKGISFYKQGQYEKAVEEFEKIVEANPEYESGFRVLGDSYLRLKRYPEASRAFHRAVQLSSGNFASHLGAALADFNMGRYQDCVTSLLRAERLAKSPKDRYQLYHLRGSAYYNLERFSESASDLEQAVAIQRGEFNDLLQLGISHFQLGNYGRARPYLEQAAALDPSSDSAKAFLNRLSYQEALAAISQQKPAEAVPLLVVYIETNPGDGDAWYNLGLAYLLAKDLGAAEKAFLRSAELRPQNWETFNRLGYLYEVRKNYPASLRNYRKAFELQSDAAVKDSIDRVQERIRREKEGLG